MFQKRYLQLTRLRRKLQRSRDSIWFLPMLMTLGAVALFVATSALDARLLGEVEPPSGILGYLIFGGSASAARNLLGAIAGGWATVMGVVFSITLVTVQLTASKYTAQVLSQFEKDTINQLTLGIFAAVFTYSLLVLKTVRTGEGDEEVFVPVLGINVAVLLAIVSILFLIAFVANLISFIRPGHFVDSTAAATVDSVSAILAPRQREWLEPLESTSRQWGGASGAGNSGRSDREHQPESERPRRWEAKTTRAGFVIAISWEILLGSLRERMKQAPSLPSNLVGDGEAEGERWHLRLERKIGDHVSRGDALALIEAPLVEQQLRTLGKWVAEAFHIEDSRRPEGDPDYGLDVLGGMGERSCSADSDARVGVACVGGIFSVLSRIIETPQPAKRLMVRAGGARLLIERPTVDLFEEAITALSRVAFAAADKQLGTVPLAMSDHATLLLLREARGGNTAVVRRLLNALSPIYEHSLSTLEMARLIRPIVLGLADVAETLSEEGRDTEARLVIDTLHQLRGAVQQRPEVAALIRRAVA